MFSFLVCFFCYGILYAENTAVSFGIQIDTAYVSNDSNIVLEYRVLAPFTFDAIDFNSKIEDDGVEIYPNPVSDFLYVNLENPSVYSMIKIYTAWGSELKTVSPLNATNQINVQDLPAGNYILNLVGSNTYKSIKFTKL